MKNLKMPIPLILLVCLFGQCQPTEKQSAATGNEVPASKSEPEAYTLAGKPLFRSPESAAALQKKDSLLAIARANYDRNSTDLQNIIWLGRRTAYLNRFQEAIAIYTRGIEKLPNEPALYRHRGHRYISTRQLDKAIADFEKAAALVKNRPIEIEPDGIPNKINQPLSTLQFNIWYHWALAYYLKGDFAKAAQLYEECRAYSTNPDLLTATADWLYMTYRRLGKPEKAAEVLALITPNLKVIENESYFNRLRMYQGKIKPHELLDVKTDGDSLLTLVTQGYGVGNWHLYNGDTTQAKQVFQRVIDTGFWSAFGYVAAEADLVRLK